MERERKRREGESRREEERGGRWEKREEGGEGERFSIRKMDLFLNVCYLRIEIIIFNFT